MGLVKKIIEKHKELAKNYGEEYDRWLVGRIFLGIGVMTINFYLIGNLFVNTKKLDDRVYLERYNSGRIQLVEYKSCPLHKEKLVDFDGDGVADIKQEVITTIAPSHPVLEGVVKTYPVTDNDQKRFEMYIK